MILLSRCTWKSSEFPLRNKSSKSLYYDFVVYPALGPIQPTIKWIAGSLLLAVKRPGREADHSPPFSAEVKEGVELYLHSPNTPPWRGAQLRHRETLPLPLPYHP
jgi:hypothetical protein